MDFILMIGSVRHILPVNPGSIKFTYESTNESIDIVNLGEVTRIATKRLQEINFESYFPTDFSSGAVNSKAPKTLPDVWVKRLEDNLQKPIRLIVTTTPINKLVTVERFEYNKFDSYTDYILDLKEYVEHKPKFIPPPKPTPKPPVPVRPAPTEKITEGCTVIANGRLHRDSYGSGPGATEVNATRKVHKIVANPKPGQNYPYHLTTVDGSWRGWVTKESVKRV